MKKQKKKLSIRPLKRQIHWQIQIGPWHTPCVPGKPNRPYPSQQFCVWSGSLPGGRFAAVLQKVNRLQAINNETGEMGNLADRRHNTVLFQKIVHAAHLKADPSWAQKAIQAAMVKAQELVADLPPEDGAGATGVTAGPHGPKPSAAISELVEVQ